MSRCRNCGSDEHVTQMCQTDGPYYPAPDRTKESYEEERKRIAALVASDIIKEHEGLHEHDGEAASPAQGSP